MMVMIPNTLICLFLHASSGFTMMSKNPGSLRVGASDFSFGKSSSSSLLFGVELDII